MKRSLLAATLALALPVTACSSENSGNNNAATSDSATTAASSAAKSEASDTSAPPPSGEAATESEAHTFKESAPVDRPVRQGEVLGLNIAELKPTMNYTAAICDANEPAEEPEPTCLVSTQVFIGNSPGRKPINEDGTAEFEIIAEFDSPALGRNDTLDCYTGACGIKVFVEKPEGNKLIGLTRFTAEP